MPTETDLLNALADDAFVVLNWARAQGMKKPQQLEQVVLAYRKTLRDNKVTLASENGETL